MTYWSYPVTDLVTGDLVADDLPLTGVQFSDGLDGAGSSMMANLAVDRDVLSPIKDHLSRLVIWPSRDGQPWGAYIPMTSSAPFSALVDRVSGPRIDAIFADRLICHDLVFDNNDQLNIARDLYRYGMGDPSGHAVGGVDPLEAWTSYAGIGNLRLGGQNSPMTRTYTHIVDSQEDDGFWAKKRKTVSGAVRQIANLPGGFEQRLAYGVESGRLFARIDFGTPRIGVADDAVDKLVFEWPGGNIRGGSESFDASKLAGFLDVVGGQAEGLVRVGTAVSARLLAAGYPTRMVAHTESSVTDQVRLDAAAAGELAVREHVAQRLTFELNPDVEPVFGSYFIGDHVRVAIDRGPQRLEQVIRITGWTVKVDDSRQAETVTPELAVTA